MKLFAWFISLKLGHCCQAWNITVEVLVGKIKFKKMKCQKSIICIVEW